MPIEPDYLRPSPAFKGHVLGVTQGIAGATVTCLWCDFRRDLAPDVMETNPHVSEAIPDLGPCPNCQTCRGPIGREAVGFVCQSCGTDYSSRDPEADPLEGLSGAESLGVLVAQAIHQAEEERDEFRTKFGDTLKILADLVAKSEPSSFAANNYALETATAWINENSDGLQSDQSPEQEPKA